MGYDAAFDFYQANEALGVAIRMCGRCGGKGGGEQWRFTGYTCYRCGGKPQLGSIPLAQYRKMEAEKAEKAAKRAAKQERTRELTEGLRTEWNKLTLRCFKALAIMKAMNIRLDSDVYSPISSCSRGYLFPRGHWLRVSTWEKKVAEARQPIEEALASLPAGWEDYVAKAPDHAKKSKWIGEIGKRQEFRATIKKIVTWQNGAFGTTYLHIMEDQDGNVLVWKGSTKMSLMTNNGWDFAEEGDKVHFKATVKDHSERWNDYQKEEVKQTVLTRCKLVAHLCRAEEVA